jgi:type II secretory pathway component PulJ
VRLRRGHSLAEALCALALGGVLAAAAGLMLASARRALEDSELRSIGGRAEREAVAIVR